ncbi:MAG: hypothetical protein ACOCRK_00590 [bacterium]
MKKNNSKPNKEYIKVYTLLFNKLPKLPPYKWSKDDYTTVINFALDPKTLTDKKIPSDVKKLIIQAQLLLMKYTAIMYKSAETPENKYNNAIKKFANNIETIKLMNYIDSMDKK